MENKKIKILHLLPLGTVGGMEQYVYSLCHFADRNRFDITVCVLFSGGIVSDKIRKTGCRVIVLNMKNGFDLIKALKIRSIIRKDGFHIVNIHGQNPLGKLCTILGRPPLIIHTDHGVSIGARVKRKRRVVLFNRLLNPFVHHFIAISEAMRESLQKREKVPAKRITLMYNGIDIESVSGRGEDLQALKASLNIDSSSFVLAMIGRLAEEKEYPLLLKSLSLLKEKGDDFVSLIIGDGPQRECLEKLSQEMGLGKYVKFLGERQDVAALLEIIDIFVFSSAAEAFSLTLLEAMAAGKPIVAFDVSGVNEAVVNGKTGHLVPFSDSEAFSEGVHSLMNDPHKTEKMGSAAFNRVKTHFTLAKNIKALESLYLSLFEETVKAKELTPSKELTL